MKAKANLLPSVLLIASVLLFELLVLAGSGLNPAVAALSIIPLLLAGAALRMGLRRPREEDESAGGRTEPAKDYTEAGSPTAAGAAAAAGIAAGEPPIPTEKVPGKRPDVAFYDAALDSLFTSIVSYLNKTSDPMSESLVKIRQAIANFVDRIRSGQLEFEHRDYASRIQSTLEGFQGQFSELTSETSETFRRLAQEVVSIGEYMDSIRKLLENISDVAERVHVLSINASIEAARAGERGRGFKVIANEIQKLARETQSIVQDITGTVAVSNRVFASINEAVSSNRGRLLAEMARDTDAYDGVRSAVDRQVSEVQELYASVAAFADALKIDLDTLSPLAMLHSIVTQEIENLDLAARDLVALVGELGGDPAALAEALEPAPASERIRKRLTTARELDALDSAIRQTGHGDSISLKRTNTDIEFF